MQIVSFWRCFNIAFSPPGVDKRIRLSNHSVMCNDSSPLPSIFYPRRWRPGTEQPASHAPTLLLPVPGSRLDGERPSSFGLLV